MYKCKVREIIALINMLGMVCGLCPTCIHTLATNECNSTSLYNTFFQQTHNYKMRKVTIDFYPKLYSLYI